MRSSNWPSAKTSATATTLRSAASPRRKKAACACSANRRVFSRHRNRTTGTSTPGPEMQFEQILRDGDRVKPGRRGVLRLGTPALAAAAERIILNIMQRMSGVATQTAVYRRPPRQGCIPVLDTRKTTPGMRVLDKMAVKIGGGENHRMGLF